MKNALRKSHSRIWSVLAVLIPLIILSAVWVKQSPDDLSSPVQISEPAAGNGS
ncbi:MAG: hypothetical protein AAF468_02990 [Pseudomonadota bacterium]